MDPTIGARFTGIWIARKTLATNTVAISGGWNMESLADMRDARTSAATAWHTTNATVTDSTNWRPGGDMAFPTHFCAKFPSPTIGRKMVFDQLRVDYFTASELA